MRLLFVSSQDDPVAWQHELSARVSGLEFIIWPCSFDPASVDVVLCYNPPAGLLRTLPNLLLVQSLAAGLDHLDGDRAPAPGITVCRLVDPSVPGMIAEYVLAAVMRHHREFDVLAAAQARQEWRFSIPRVAADRRVGILGLGPLGVASATLLSQVGFPVVGWSRGTKDVPGVEVFPGAVGLEVVARRSDVLVCLLPLTAETTGILNRSLLALLPAGAALVNIGRGAHLVDADLLSALDSGKLSGATLDVFPDEPLPAGHPFWCHPKILVTPHVAAFPRPASAAPVVAERLARLIAGKVVTQEVSTRTASAPPPHPITEQAPTLPDLVHDVAAIVGQRGLLTSPSDTAPYCEDWRQLYQGRTPAVVRPKTTEECSAVVRLCAGRRVAIVPQGGNTSMVGGAVPDESGQQIVLSLQRMRAVRNVNPVDLTLTVEAGVTLKAAQDAAANAGCLLPISIASEGTAQIGGILATNAGGNTTVRYGNARELVLGLEVVLPDGAVWHGLRRLHKDNTGYCLHQLLVGSEGTLGIITAAVLRLVPQPREIAVALCALPSVTAVLELFTRFQRHDAAVVQAFEYMCGAGMALVLTHIPGIILPLAAPAAHYALVELATTRPGAGLRESIEEVLATALEDGVVTDAALAESEAQRVAIWRLREEHSEAQKREGASVKNDVSVPVSRVPDLIARGTDAVLHEAPGARVVAFGHIGDGNIHFNVLQPEGTDAASFLACDHAIMDAVNEVVRSLDGSFSAEHGVGQLKTYLMPLWRGGAELETMRRIKAALDPLGIMNPGKVLPPGRVPGPSA